IRTSEWRTSGFMLFRAAYAELIFNTKYWPDFTVADLDAALEEYRTRRRRFGT
ncbi:undecaprenyl diphosphate synthase family protein, partial [Candidatus Saccharibacteria bacterium]|nr:undecaprenyl diphosphate synthase family protein [Candidatus Saccharibacteria bacterium]